MGDKSAYLKGNLADVELLKFLHITHVTLANNHMYDYNAQGLEDTIDILEKMDEKNDIRWYGVDGKTAIIKENETCVILMGFCCYLAEKGWEVRSHI